MFFVRYARSELARRRGRTIVTVSGLALGVALVIVIASLTRGLDRAQDKALDPLASIGTDLTITLSPSEDSGGGFGPGGGGGGREVVQANSSVITDLSKLGKPGEKFEHTFFLPGTQLTFPRAQAVQVAKVDGVASAASGLILTAVHQSGTVPKIVAQIRAGGQQVQVDRQIPRPTQAELQKMQTCLQGKGIQFGPGGGAQQGGGAGGQGGQGGGLGAPTQQAGPGGVDGGAFASCLPERLRRFRATITTPQQTLRQVVDPPQTNITSTTYTIGGVDMTQTDIGIVTPALVTNGTFLRKPGQALVTQTYASREGLKVGSTVDLNGTSFTVVGLVRAPLGGQTADVYVPLAQLQKLSSQKGQVNVVLVRADSGNDVASVQQNIENQYPSAQVASARDVADRISGSLVDASNLSHRLGVALAVLARSDRLPHRAPAHALLGRQARPRDRHAEGTRLEAADRRPSDPRRVPRPGSSPAGSSASSSAIARRRDRRSRADAHGVLVDRWRQRLLRARRGHRPDGHRSGRAHRAGRPRRSSCSASRRRSSAASSPGRPEWLACSAHAARRRAEAGRVMAAETLYEVRGAARFFQRGPSTVRALDGVDLDIAPGRARRARGAQRLGQDDAAAAARCARPAPARGPCGSRDRTSARSATAPSPSSGCGRSASCSSSST